jgi:hypothetical protein
MAQHLIKIHVHEVPAGSVLAPTPTTMRSEWLRIDSRRPATEEIVT